MIYFCIYFRQLDAMQQERQFLPSGEGSVIFRMRPGADDRALVTNRDEVPSALRLLAVPSKDWRSETGGGTFLPPSETRPKAVR